jgi:integrase
MGAKGVRTKFHLLNVDEMKLLRDGAQSLPERVFIFIPLYTGMRISEILHMRKEWIDPNTNEIAIPPRQQCDCYDCMKVKKNKQLGWWSPKTDEGIRRISILPDRFPELKTVLDEVFKEHKIIMEIAKSRAAARNIINVVAKRSGLSRKLFPHLFRGTYAKQLAMMGFDAYYITAIMGWHDIKVASEYIKMFGSEVRKEMEQRMKRF